MRGMLYLKALSDVPISLSPIGHLLGVFKSRVKKFDNLRGAKDFVFQGGNLRDGKRERVQRVTDI